MGGSVTANAIQRVFRFPDFKAAMQFVNKIADAAEQANHHPDIDIRYNTSPWRWFHMIPGA